MGLENHLALDENKGLKRVKLSPTPQPMTRNSGIGTQRKRCGKAYQTRVILLFPPLYA